MGAYRRHVELTDEELERLEAVMYLRPCAWVVSATGVSWSTAVSQARRCRASLTPSTLAQSQPKREPRTADSCTGRDESDHTGV